MDYGKTLKAQSVATKDFRNRHAFIISLSFEITSSLRARLATYNQNQITEPITIHATNHVLQLVNCFKWPSVLAILKLAKIPIEMLRTHVVTDAHEPTIYHAPERLHSIGAYHSGRFQAPIMLA